MNVRQRLTVLLTCFHPARAVHLDAQVRNALRCRFVEKVVVSSHNPEISGEAAVRIRDPRLTFMNAPVARGCGHRWTVAGALDPRYLLVLDDDMLLRTSQIAGLFRRLVDEPDLPHGLSGLRHVGGNGLDFVDRRHASVDYLCEAYAVTQRHLARYAALRALLADATPIRDLIDGAFDFMLISRCGLGSPRIHDLGHILRCETFATPGVAVHKADGFEARLMLVARALAERA